MSAEIIVTTKEQLESLVRSAIKDELTLALAKENLSQQKQEWLTVKQKAEQENISVSMVYKLLAQGEYETKTIGRKRLIKA